MTRHSEALPPLAFGGTALALAKCEPRPAFPAAQLQPEFTDVGRLMGAMGEAQQVLQALEDERDDDDDDAP